MNSMKSPSESDPLASFPSEKATPKVPAAVRPSTSPQVGSKQHQRSPGRVRKGILAIAWVLFLGVAAGAAWMTTGVTLAGVGDLVGGLVAWDPREREVSRSDASAIEEEPPTGAPSLTADERSAPTGDTETSANGVAQPVVLWIGNSGVGTDVVDRQLVGRSNSFPAGSAVVFWTLVRGGQPGSEVRHLWLQDERVANAVILPVESPQWRTFSRLQFAPGEEGVWLVEARDGQDRVLVRHEFRIGDGGVAPTE